MKLILLLLLLEDGVAEGPSRQPRIRQEGYRAACKSGSREARSEKMCELEAMAQARRVERRKIEQPTPPPVAVGSKL